MFNGLPKSIRTLSLCVVVVFKSQLDTHLRNIVDLPCRPGFNNSLDGVEHLYDGDYADDMAASQMQQKQTHTHLISWICIRTSIYYVCSNNEWAYFII